MPHVDLPQYLFQQIEKVLPASASVDGFVRDAVREKIAWKERRDEFFRLSATTRKALEEHGLTEQGLELPFSDEEIERRRNESGGRELAEILIAWADHELYGGMDAFSRKRFGKSLDSSRRLFLHSYCC